MFRRCQLLWRDARALLVAECCTVVLCAPCNFACNSHVNLSNMEMGSLELQRLWAVLKTDQGELPATFGVLCLVSVGGGSRRCRLCRCWHARMRIGSRLACSHSP